MINIYAIYICIYIYDIYIYMIYIYTYDKGDQLKIKLVNLNFSEIGDGRLFWGTFSIRRKGLL